MRILKHLFGAGLLAASLLSSPPFAQAQTPTGSLITARSGHTETLLPNGKVLIAGGYIGTSGSVYTASAELYNPTTGTWTNTGAMNAARISHTATLLPNGKVLVSGGTSNGGTGLASAELYDPATGTWTLTGPLGAGRMLHTATLLSNGKVLVAAGGIWPGCCFLFFNSAELYDPAAGTWAPANPLTTARVGATATLLPNGKVLILGGTADGHVGLASAELYDPATGTWAVTGSMTTGRLYHTATLLPSGKVLAAAGYHDQFGVKSIASAELYDSTNGTWTATSALTSARHAHTATLLPNGTVLVTGGSSNEAAEIASAELYNPAGGAWTTATGLLTARHQHTATLLPNGKVLIAAGITNAAADYVTSSAELYDAALSLYSECQDLNNNQMPAGWSMEVGTGVGSSFANGRLNAYQVDGGAGITRVPFILTNAANRIKLEWTSYLAPIYWGMGSAGYIALDHGGECSAASRVSTYGWGSDEAAYFSVNGLNSPMSRVPMETGTFRNSLVFEKGHATFEVRRTSDGSLFNTVTTNSPAFAPELATSATFSLRVSTTTGPSTWIDDICFEVQYATNIAPTITTNPVTQTVGLGGSATFCVTATGSTPMNYQWYLNGSEVGGANGACFTIPTTSPAWLGSYQVKVWNSAGTNWSTTAGLWLDTLKMYAGVNVYGPAGSNCVVQYATNLTVPVTWTPLKSVTILNNPTVIIDYDSPGQPKRFYRTVPQ